MTEMLTKNFELQPPQLFIQDYVNYKNDFGNGCLIFHLMGSGKTCTSIIVGEAYKFFNKQKTSLCFHVDHSLLQ